MAKRDVCNAIGNYGRGMKIKDFNPKEVKIGMEVEKEHTLDECIREKIVLDHLSEIDDYYTRLIKMETEAKNEKRKRKR